jgi:hypothetical protein
MVAGNDTIRIHLSAACQNKVDLTTDDSPDGPDSPFPPHHVPFTSPSLSHLLHPTPPRPSPSITAVRPRCATSFGGSFMGMGRSCSLPLDSPAHSPSTPRYPLLFPLTRSPIRPLLYSQQPVHSKDERHILDGKSHGGEHNGHGDQSGLRYSRRPDSCSRRCHAARGNGECECIVGILVQFKHKPLDINASNLCIDWRYPD